MMRVLILYTLINQRQLCKRLFISWSFISYILSFADSVGNIFGEVLCIQLDAPFQDGAIFVSTTFAFRNNVLNTFYFCFSTGIIVLIVITTGLVFVKLRSIQIKRTTSSSLNRAKAETTLTVTTILIIIPLLLAQGLTVSSLLKSPYYSYFLCVRPLMVDLRVNIVSIYFYMTHPVFKRPPSTVAVMSFGSVTF
uniref:G_PROTEIN_RECEP_F1_2 domain-containing protein n=1 Tax=Caenorhabditis tropicalis TaxID=1561998 RepID=A0A1I7U9M7_9PELO